MISNKITMKSCVGKYAVTDICLTNKLGVILEKGCKVKIVGASNKGMTIQTDVCPYCKQAFYITHVKRNYLTLL